MMQNPNTTVYGILLLISSLCTVVVHVMQGDFSSLDLQSLIGALGGIGLISAKDGSV